MKKKILILCSGNSCRSQMAEALLKSFDDELEVYSAGVQPAQDVNRRTIQVMREIGVDISLNIVKDCSVFINDDFDCLITVCKYARMNCPDFKGEIKSIFHLGFDAPWEVRGSNDDMMKAFRDVRDQIKREFFRFYIEILSKVADE